LKVLSFWTATFVYDYFRIFLASIAFIIISSLLGFDFIHALPAIILYCGANLIFLYVYQNLFSDERKAVSWFIIVNYFGSTFGLIAVVISKIEQASF